MSAGLDRLRRHTLHLLDHHEDIIATIERALTKNNRKERLVVYDGTIDDGNGQKRKMTYQEQFSLFRSSILVIGPHGTGLSNVVWMDPNSNARNQVVEFTIGPSTIGTFGDTFRGKSIAPYSFSPSTFLTRITEPFAKTHLYKYWGLPFEYRYLLFAPNSTNDRAFIDLEVLVDVLDEILSTAQGTDQ